LHRSGVEVLLLRKWNKDDMLLKGSSPSEEWVYAADAICSKRDPYPEKATGIYEPPSPQRHPVAVCSLSQRTAALYWIYFPLCMVTPQEEYDSNETRRSMQLKRLAPRY
jgi:hypothetical protein